MGGVFREWCLLHLSPVASRPLHGPQTHHFVALDLIRGSASFRETCKNKAKPRIKSGATEGLLFDPPRHEEPVEPALFRQHPGVRAQPALACGGKACG